MTSCAVFVCVLVVSATVAWDYSDVIRKWMGL